MCLSLPPAPFYLFSPVESRPVGVHGKRGTGDPRSIACAVVHTVTLPLPGRGMNGCGPTALVRPDRGDRRRRDCARGERASQRLGPPLSVLLWERQGQSFGRRWIFAEPLEIKLIMLWLGSACMRVLWGPEAWAQGLSRLALPRARVDLICAKQLLPDQSEGWRGLGKFVLA